MLLFIGTACQIALGRNGFNTSHVTLYLMPLSFQIKYLKCFNTSHVTLYQCGYVLATTVHGFQYISCYSLSKERKTRLTIPVSFNTSHVTLYPGGIQRSDYGLIVSIHLMLLFIFVKCASDAVMRTFQYISCYSLSTCWKPCISEVKFQYISCYSLSTKKRKLVISLRCFNTSHVTLYLLTLSLLEALGHVSIHLMLLFIDMQATGM